MKFEKKIWVIIKSCKHETAWYADKIGTIQRVTDELFPPDYTLIDKQQNKKSKYPMIDKDDVEIVTPSILKRFLLWIGVH